MSSRAAEEARRILEKVLAMPSSKASDTRVKRRVRVELKRLLAREDQ